MVHPLLYICHPVVHRKLQNVVYMKKNRCSKKKKKGATYTIGSCPRQLAQDDK
jgi:hypothetical protein